MWRAAISRNTASSKISKAINDVKKISDTASSISRNTTSSKICNAMMTSNKISYAASSYRSVCVAAWITSKKLWTVAAEQPRHGQCATEKKSAAWEISPRPMWENAQKKWQPEQPLHGQCGVLNAQKKWQPGQPLHGQCGVLNTQKKWQPEQPLQSDQMSQELIIFWDSLVFPIIIFWDSLVFPNGRSNSVWFFRFLYGFRSRYCAAWWHSSEIPFNRKVKVKSLKKSNQASKPTINSNTTICHNTPQSFSQKKCIDRC